MTYDFDYGSCNKITKEIFMPTEFEVRQFIRMNALQKDKLYRTDRERFNQLKEAADKMFPTNDDSAVGEVVMKGDR